MPIKFSCPNCGMAYTASEQSAGTVIECKHAECGQWITIKNESLPIAVPIVAELAEQPEPYEPALCRYCGAPIPTSDSYGCRWLVCRTCDEAARSARQLVRVIVRERLDGPDHAQEFFRRRNKEIRFALTCGMLVVLALIFVVFVLPIMWLFCAGFGR